MDRLDRLDKDCRDLVEGLLYGETPERIVAETICMIERRLDYGPIFDAAVILAATALAKHEPVHGPAHEAASRGYPASKEEILSERILHNARRSQRRAEWRRLLEEEVSYIF